MKGKKVKCKNCEYEWRTMSDRKYVTCPNCMRKTKIEKEEEE